MATKGKTSNVQGTEDTVTSQQTSFFNQRFPNYTENILKGYESVTYRFSMGAVTASSYAEASYLDDNTNGKDSRYIVFGESGYTGSSQNTETSLNNKNNIGKRVVTASGVPEYFVDNFILKIMQPGNGTGFEGVAGGSFEVYEPYSLGLFLESLLASAINAGFQHFNDHCPFVIRIDFFGYKNGIQQEIKDASRVFPIRLQNIEFKANESGSTYIVHYLDFGTSVLTDDTIKQLENTCVFPMGANLRETVKNFEKYLNDREANRVAEKLRQIPDEFVLDVQNEDGLFDARTRERGAPLDKFYKEIKFLDSLDDYERHKTFKSSLVDYGDRFPDSTANVDKSPIGTSDTNARIINDQAGTTSFVYNSSTNAKTDVYTVLNDLMCHTEFAKESFETVNKDGYALWWMIVGQTRHQVDGENVKHDLIDGRIPLKFDITIKPFWTRLDRLKQPGVVLEDTPAVKATINKVYSYMYTGQNDDVLNFDMNFNNMFYIAGQPQAWSKTAEESLKKIRSNDTIAENEDVNQRSLTAMQELSIGNVVTKPAGHISIAGGTGVTTTEIEVARWINKHVTGTDGNSYDVMVQLRLELTILGDTYWLPMAGLGNQLEPSSDEMRWKGEDVRVFVRFRTIEDYPYNGSSLSIVKDNGFKDHPYSGIYRVYIVKNEFTGGVFKQTLSMAKDFSIDPDQTVENQQAQAQAQDINPILYADITEGRVNGDNIIPKTPEPPGKPNANMGQGNIR